MISSEVLNEVHLETDEGILLVVDLLEILRDSTSETYSPNSDEDEEDNPRHEVSNSISEISSVAVCEVRSAEAREKYMRKDPLMRSNQ